MKKFISISMFILCAFLFTQCSDDFETPGKNSAGVVESPVLVKVGYSASLFLKDGGDDEEPIPMFDIAGVVTENGNPVAASVELVSAPESTLINITATNSSGEFTFYQVSSGSYNVVVKIGGNVVDIIGITL